MPAPEMQSDFIHDESLYSREPSQILNSDHNNNNDDVIAVTSSNASTVQVGPPSVMNKLPKYESTASRAFMPIQIRDQFTNEELSNVHQVSMSEFVAKSTSSKHRAHITSAARR